jgi:hypothetical protein
MYCKVLETWGIDSDEDQLHIQSLDGKDCRVLAYVRMAIHSEQRRM